MKFKVKTPLSDIPSRAIRQAVGDCRVVGQHPNYKLNMGIWHGKKRNSRICNVCLGGATLARRTGARHTESLTPGDFPNDIRSKLMGLDYFRFGDIYAGLVYFNVPEPIRCKWEAREHILLPNDDEMELLFSQLLELASDLEKAGL